MVADQRTDQADGHINLMLRPQEGVPGIGYWIVPAARRQGIASRAIDKRKIKKVALHHLPWTEVLTAAVMQKEYRGVADPDQAWILGELIRYLEHPRSGAMEFSDMGSAWVPARDAVTAGTLRPGDAIAPEVAGRFDALVRYAGLKLGRRLGTEVTPALTRRDLNEPGARTQTLVDQLASIGMMTASLKIPGAVGPLHVTADLRAGQIVCHVDVDAPREGRPTTRVNWLVRQLKDAPDTVRIEAFTMHARGPGSAELLRVVRTDPAVLLRDPTKELRSFRVAQSAPAGTKRGTGRGTFIDSLLAAIDDFYECVIQNLKPWMPAPPRLRAPDEPQPVEPVPVSLVSTSISSQDGPQPNDRATGETSGDRSAPVRTAAAEQHSRVAEAEDKQIATSEAGERTATGAPTTN